MALMVKEGKGWVPQSAREEGLRAAQLLKDWIQRKKWSIREVEEQIGWGQKTLNPVLSGDQPIRFSHVAAVVEVLGGDVVDFYTELVESRRSSAREPLSAEASEQPAEARNLPHDSPQAQTLGAVELLLAQIVEASIKDPSLGEHLGLLALRLLDGLDPAHHDAARIADLRARAWALVGNAHRLRFDFQRAEEAFTAAQQELERGTREEVEEAIFLDLKASLRRGQRRFDEALRLLEQAVELFTRHGEEHLAGRSLVNMATIHNHAGNLEAAISLLHEALPLIDPEREPRLLLSARHNLLFCTADLGRFLEAQRLYRQTLPLYRNFKEPWVQNRRKWVQGSIAKGFGKLRRAEALFLSTRDGFIAEGLPYDTALVSLELALLYAEQGRTEDLKRLADEMVPIFASRHIHREALAALSFFQQAVKAETASAELVARVAAYLRRAEGDPTLPFESGGGTD